MIPVRVVQSQNNTEIFDGVLGIKIRTGVIRIVSVVVAGDHVMQTIQIFHPLVGAHPLLEVLDGTLHLIQTEIDVALMAD